MKRIAVQNMYELAWGESWWIRKATPQSIKLTQDPQEAITFNSVEDAVAYCDENGIFTNSLHSKLAYNEEQNFDPNAEYSVVEIDVD